MPTRRDVLSSLVAAFAANRVKATPILEPELQPGDLVVIELDEYIDDDSLEFTRRVVQSQLPPSQKVLVLDRGVRLTVHRGIAKVERRDDG